MFPVVDRWVRSGVRSLGAGGRLMWLSRISGDGRTQGQNSERKRHKMVMYKVDKGTRWEEGTRWEK